LALESALHAEQRVLSGKIRFTCSEAMANIVVMPCLREFRSKYPDIIVDLIADDHFLDLAVGEADVALRAGSRPEGTGIVARRLQDPDGHARRVRKVRFVGLECLLQQGLRRAARASQNG